MDYFSCQRPWAFYGLLFLIPAIALSVSKYIKLIQNGTIGNSAIFQKLKRRLVIRLIFWSLSWTMLVTAYSGLFWGAEPRAVHQSGKDLALVFDVSWSMTAKDIVDGNSSAMTRLEAVASYTEGLLDKLDETKISAVLAKGEGMIAIPQTNDKNAIYPLIHSLSPRLMSTVGSSLGGGINAAMESFPTLSISARTILVFTDGEETDGTLARATETALRSGIQIIFLGFGSEQETKIISGDGKTPVSTALRSESLINMVSQVNAKVSDISKTHRQAGLGLDTAKAFYIPAQKKGSAHQVLKIIKDFSSFEKKSTTIYEMHSVPRWKLFCFLALLFLIAGIFFSELNISKFSSSKKSLLPIMLICFTGLFQGCNAKWNGSKNILEGAFHWYRKEYREAVTSFMDTIEYAKEENDPLLKQYALYGLASTYLAQGEQAAALSRLNELPPDTPDNIKFATLYNSGIISYNKGNYNEAAVLFRQALLIDEGNIDAKINLEMSLQQQVNKSTEGVQELNPVQENQQKNQLESAIFSLIREKETNQWKNQQSQENSNSNLDY